MKAIQNDFGQDAYEYVTESGLHVTLIQRLGFKRSIAVYGTPFGSLDLVQKVDGKLVKHRTGLAHFLEHKLFEDEVEDVFSQFAAYGANANAFTSHDQTVYYFSTNGEVKKPLGILIDFVSRFQLNQERVDKEKGIILEELRMYAKMPDTNLLMKTYENVYHNFPMRIDIGGTEEDVSNMLLEDLETAYAINYQDKRMGLVVVTGESLDEIKTIIDEHTKSHRVGNLDIETVFEKEPVDVVQEYEEIYDEVQTPKMSVAYKFAYDMGDTQFQEYIARLILEMNFSEVNPEYQTWLDEEIINESFGFDVDLRDGFGVIIFFNEGDNFDAFKSLVDQRMQNLSINERIFYQLKKRMYGQLIMAIDRYDRFAMNVLYCQFKGLNYFEYLRRIRDCNLEDITLFINVLKNFSISSVVMKPNIK